MTKGSALLGAALEPATIGGAAAAAARRLAAAGIGEPRLEARLLVCAASGLSLERFVSRPDQVLATDLAARMEGLVARRARREPLGHILGRREFWSLDFSVTRDVLVPRPETETLVEAALELAPDRRAALRILDLGTGSGCILLALLSELPAASGMGVDVSPAVARLARQNAAVLGLNDRAQFAVGDWSSAMASGAFDLVLANPPYVPDGEIDNLAPEIADYEPRQALMGGSDGLGCYRVLAADLKRLLRPRGHVLLEIGQGQAEAVSRLMMGGGMVVIGQRMDLAVIPRCLIMRVAAVGDSAGQG